ncbi:hypothetical protein A9320_07935 [Ruegeria sp. PBVC088]|nr:hypothetical protein A9320_07935 [Ruegeria sp. PBVC088]
MIGEGGSLGISHLIRLFSRIRVKPSVRRIDLPRFVRTAVQKIEVIDQIRSFVRITDRRSNSIRIVQGISRSNLVRIRERPRIWLIALRVIL